MEAEWKQLYGTIQDVNYELLNALTKLGKNRYVCGNEVSRNMSNDPDMKLKARQTGLETPMMIRRARYELEAVWAHQHDFLKAFTTAVLAAQPEVKAIAESIKIPTLAPPKKAPIASAKSSSTATTLVTSTAPPTATPKAVCTCKYYFLPSDSKTECETHLDTCEDFQKQDQTKKTALLSKLGLSKNAPNQTQPRNATITCHNCKREFANIHSQWFYNQHVKTCKAGAPNYNDAPGSIPSTPQGPRATAQNKRTPQVTPSKSFTLRASSQVPMTSSPRTPVSDNNWQKRVTAPGADTTQLKTSGGLMGQSKWANDNFVPRLPPLSPNDARL